MNPVDEALGQVAEERIENDGSVCYMRATLDPRTGKRRTELVMIGRVALARFPAGTQALRIDSVHVRAPRGVVPHIGMPADGNFPMVLPHARDVGKLDLLSGLGRLQEAYLSFEALKSARVAENANVKTTMGCLNDRFFAF